MKRGRASGIESRPPALPLLSSRPMHQRVALSLVLSLTAACDGDAGKTVTDAAKATQKSVDDATKTAGKTIDDAKSLAAKTTDDAKRLADATTLFAKKAWAGVTNPGELSSSAVTWIGDRAQEVDGAKVEKVIAKGVQIAPVAVEIALVVNEAVDDDTAIEPIYQKIAPDGDLAEVDAAIGSMPRVEVIDGVKVGFSQLSSLDAGKKVDESAYLVTWRREDRLIGLVYRTKRTIDLDALVKETPRLMEMTKKALAEP